MPKPQRKPSGVVSAVRRANENPAAPARAGIAMILFDFDGVLTDNRVWVNQDGVESVCCNRADGLGFSLLKAAGLRCAIVSTETNLVVTQRGRKVGVPVVQGVADKGHAVRQICQEHGIDPARVAFVGNDLNDLPAFQIVGLKICPCDAAPEIRRICDHVLCTHGGAGVARELARRWRQLFRQRKL